MRLEVHLRFSHTDFWAHNHFWYHIYCIWDEVQVVLLCLLDVEKNLFCDAEPNTRPSPLSDQVATHTSTHAFLWLRVLESLLTRMFWLRGCHFRPSTTQWLISLVVCVWSSTMRNSQHLIWKIELGRWRMRVCIPVFDHLVYVLLTYSLHGTIWISRCAELW